MSRTLLVMLLLVCLAWASPGRAENPGLTQAIDQMAQDNYPEAIAALEQLVQESASEEVYYYLGSAYVHEKNWGNAATTFEEGAGEFPLSARLHNEAAKAYEQLFDLAKAVVLYRRAVALSPLIAYTGGGRYDPEFDAIYIPVVHDHRGANTCGGRLYVDGEQMHYVVYYVASEWGAGKDDSFVLSFDDLEYVEIDRKEGQQWVDYSMETLLTNLSAPRRRIASGEESRLDLKFVPKGKIEGYRGKPWTKKDIKFFFIEPEVGERFLKFLEANGVKTTLRK